MEVENGEKKTCSIFKKLQRYLSINRHDKSSTMTRSIFTKCKSWHSSTSKASKRENNSNEKHKADPNGCFSVYVGAEKQRFVIKIEFANHPLFKILLEDAELEYGFNREGPLLIPCEVDLFCKILAEMDCGKEFDDQYPSGFSYGSCSPFSSARRLGKSGMAKGCTSYGLLTPPRLLKINHFYAHKETSV